VFDLDVTATINTEGPTVLLADLQVIDFDSNPDGLMTDIAALYNGGGLVLEALSAIAGDSLTVGLNITARSDNANPLSPRSWGDQGGLTNQIAR
jgi:hypothetical protein